MFVYVFFLYLCNQIGTNLRVMKQKESTPIYLPEEQEKFFIDTWENNRCENAKMILHEELGLPIYAIENLSRQLREEGKIRNKRLKRYSERDVLVLKREYEHGMSLNEIAKVHKRGIKAVRRYLKELYGGKIPKIQGKLEGEVWKDIEGCSTHQISNLGRIFIKSNFRIELGTESKGYRYVRIKDESGNYHRYAVHRLVAKAFVPNPSNKPEVDHIDSNPLNNDASNLRWVTHEEQYNNEDSIKKKKLGHERFRKRTKIVPLIRRMLEIEPDKLELVKMIIDYKE